MKLNEATRQYQQALEHHRTVCELEDATDMLEALRELSRAQRTLNAAWLEHAWQATPIR